MKRTKNAALLLLAVWVLRSFGGEVSEYSVKAAYLFNFTKFVEWPPGTFSKGGAALVIGVLGDDPFGDKLDGAVQGKTVQGRKIEIRRFDSFDSDSGEGLKKCQILFIAYSEKDRIKDILKNLEGAPVLTVSEIEQFPLVGGMVLFDQVGNHIQLVVNPEAAQKAGLGLSARLLQVSKIYRQE